MDADFPIRRRADADKFSIPHENEMKQLVALYNDSHAQLAERPKASEKLATKPLGMLPPNMNAVDAAAMTVVANVLLNLDEMVLKR